MQGNSKVHFIPPTPKREKRVVIYCRVSTNSMEQLQSLAAQVSHLTRLTATMPQYVLADAYMDIATSKTGSSRKEFNRMLDNCQSHKLNMILTKSISRFGRDTVEILEALNQLKQFGVRVIFEQEELDTAKTDSDLMISVIEALAQAENESRSDNIRVGIKYRAAAGTSKLYDRKCYGYKHDEDGKLVIDEEKAKDVKLIFELYLVGQSVLGIVKELEKRQILSPTGKEKWCKRTVDVMLSNEKYIGDALLQKTYTVDFLTKKRVSNNGIVPQYYVENSHPAIIPRDLYMQVQEEILRRANIHSGTEQKKRVYSSRYALSSIVVCGHCGDIFRRIKWNNRGCKSTVWRCVSRVEKGGPDCSARTVKEETLQEVVVKAVNEMMADQETFLPLLQANIESALDGNSQEAIAAIDEKLTELQKELLKLANAKKDYEPIADAIDSLREEKQNILVDDAEREGIRQCRR